MNSIKGRPASHVLIALLMVSTLLIMININTVNASPTQPVFEWNKTFGGPYTSDEGWSVQQTSDGGYIIVGGTRSYWSNRHDILLIKTDAKGNMMWNRTFRGSSWGGDFSVQQTSDGGYIIVGTWSSGNGWSYAWLIKTDARGNKEWDKTFGDPGKNVGRSVRQTSDGGYIITGTFTGTSGRHIWLIKTDANGNKEWSKTFGGLGGNVGRSVWQTSDGGYSIVGMSGGRIWLIKMDASGNIQGSKTVFIGDNWPHSIHRTSDGGYIIVGYTMSYRADDSDILSSTQTDVWLMKMDANGNREWSKTFGGPGDDEGHSVQQTSDGGYIIVGETMSYGAGYEDVWLIKTDADGNMQWNETFGGPDSEWGNSVRQTSDGGYIIVGVTDSYGAGFRDVWLIKVSENGSRGSTSSKTNKSSETPAKPSTTTGSGGGGICGPGIIIALATAPLLFKRKKKRCDRW